MWRDGCDYGDANMFAKRDLLGQLVFVVDYHNGGCVVVFFGNNPIDSFESVVVVSGYARPTPFHLEDSTLL